MDSRRASEGLPPPITKQDSRRASKGLNESASPKMRERAMSTRDGSEIIGSIQEEGEELDDGSDEWVKVAAEADAEDEDDAVVDTVLETIREEPEVWQDPDLVFLRLFVATVQTNPLFGGTPDSEPAKGHAERKISWMDDTDEDVDELLQTVMANPELYQLPELASLREFVAQVAERPEAFHYSTTSLNYDHSEEEMSSDEEDEDDAVEVSDLLDRVLQEPEVYQMDEFKNLREFVSLVENNPVYEVDDSDLVGTSRSSSLDTTDEEMVDETLEQVLQNPELYQQDEFTNLRHFVAMVTEDPDTFSLDDEDDVDLSDLEEEESSDEEEEEAGLSEEEVLARVLTQPDVWEAQVAFKKHRVRKSITSIRQSLTSLSESSHLYESSPDFGGLQDLFAKMNAGIRI